MKLITSALSALIVLGSDMTGGHMYEYPEPDMHEYGTGDEMDGYGPGDEMHGYEPGDEMHGYGMEDEMHEDYGEMPHEKSHVFHLTSDNFNEETKGKSVFIKFFSPECENCTAMDPAWSELAEIYEGSDTALIGEVDCQGPGEDLCIKLNIDDNFPTLMYGDPENLKHYTEPLEFYALVVFAGINVEPICGPANKHLCSADEKKKIDSMVAQGVNSLWDKVDSVLEVIHSGQTKFEDEIEKLYEDIEVRYSKLLLEKEKLLDELREKNDIVLLRTVLDHLRDQFPDHIDL